MQKTCSWAGHEWLIPAIYSCGKGLVIDICRSVSREDMENFARKWNLIDENGQETEPPAELLAQIEREHPMNFQYRMEVTLDGRNLQSDHGCGITYNPMEMPASEAMEMPASETMEMSEAQDESTSCDEAEAPSGSDFFRSGDGRFRSPADAGYDSA